MIKIKGQHYYMWRAVDQTGVELDILVTEGRDKKAAKSFFKRLLHGCKYESKVVVTDKLRSYSAALRDVLPNSQHIAHKSANNRAENSHRHVRKRERHLQRFKSPEHAQDFMEDYCIIKSQFCPRRHNLDSETYRGYLNKQFSMWEEIYLRIGGPLPFTDMVA